VAVSVDPAEGPQGQIAFAAHLGVDFPFLPDTGRNVTLLYNNLLADTRSGRMSVLIDKEGIVRLIDKDVHIRTHGAEMLARMREMGLAKPLAATTLQPAAPTVPPVITPTVPSMTTRETPQPTP